MKYIHWLTLCDHWLMAYNHRFASDIQHLLLVNKHFTEFKQWLTEGKRHCPLDNRMLIVA